MDYKRDTKIWEKDIKINKNKITPINILQKGLLKNDAHNKN